MKTKHWITSGIVAIVLCNILWLSAAQQQVDWKARYDISCQVIGNQEVDKLIKADELTRHQQYIGRISAELKAVVVLADLDSAMVRLGLGERDATDDK